MIKKDNLLRQINELITLEKSLVPLLNKHISASLLFSNLKEDERKELVATFQKLVIAKTRHIEILNGVRDEVTRGTKDVY